MKGCKCNGMVYTMNRVETFVWIDLSKYRSISHTTHIEKNCTKYSIFQKKRYLYRTHISRFICKESSAVCCWMNKKQTKEENDSELNRRETNRYRNNEKERTETQQKHPFTLNRIQIVKSYCCNQQNSHCKMIMFSFRPIRLR